MNFKEFLEGKTYRDRDGLRVVYHFDDQGEWKEVLRKQKIGLWVAPNLGQDLVWGGWVAGGGGDNTNDNSIYLHKLGIPEWLFDKLMSQEVGQTRPSSDPARPLDMVNNVTELVIPPEHWRLVKPLGVKHLRRSQVLKMAAKQRGLEANIEKRPMPRNTKKFGMDVLPTGEPHSDDWSREEYEERKNRKYRRYPT
jgi:hypothetical protein